MDKEELKNKLIDLLRLQANEYLDSYIEIIERNRKADSIKFSTERHHIIPVYYFRDNGVDVDNSNDNIVNLRFRDHVLAHYYLCNCSTGKYKNFNCIAVMTMLGRTEFPLDQEEILKDMPLYEELKAQSLLYMSEKMKNRVILPEWIAKSVTNRAGYRHTEQTIDRIRSSNKGKKHNISVEGMYNLSYKKKESHWYNNGSKEMFFHDTDLIPEGFVRGRLPMSQEHIEKLCISQQKRFQTSRGTMLGKKLTLEQRKKLSSSLTGRKIPIETVTKLSNTLKGSKMYTNGTITVRVLKDEKPPEGFVPGMPRKKRDLSEKLGLDIAGTNLEEL